MRNPNNKEKIYFTKSFDFMLEKYGPTPTLIYGKIYRLSNSNGYCHAKQTTMAKDLGISRGTFIRNLKILIDDEIIIDHNPGIRNKSHTLTVKDPYVLKWNIENEISTKMIHIKLHNGTYMYQNGTYNVSKCNMNREVNKEKNKEGNIIISKNPKALKAWEAVKSHLQHELDKTNYDTWVKIIQFISFENGKLTLGVHNSNAQKYLENRYTNTVRRKMEGLMGADVEIRFVVKGE